MCCCSILSRIEYSAVVNYEQSEEERRVNARLEALNALSESHQVFWRDRSAASLIVRFQDRVEQVQVFFKECRDRLLMILQTMFPLNPAPRSLTELMIHFKTPARVRSMVREQLVSGAEVAFAFVQAEYPTLDLSRISGRSVNLRHWAARVKHPASVVIQKLEAADEAERREAAEQQ